MKKIVTIICLFSVLLTAVVFSVSANEASFDTPQNERPIAKNEESDVTPEEDTVAPVEEVTEADTIALVEETTKAETAKPKKEFLTDSSYYGLLHGPHEVDTEGVVLSYEDLPPEVQAEIDAREAEHAKEQAEREWFFEEFDPFKTVSFQDNVYKSMNAEAYKKAEAMIIAEVAKNSAKQNDELTQISINAEGKLVSDAKIVLSEEAVLKLAHFYYETYSNYYRSINKAYFADLPLRDYEYFEEEGCWFFYFQNDYQKNPEKGFRHWTVVVKDNGELYGMGW